MPTRRRMSCRALSIIVLVRPNLSWAPGLPPAKSGSDPPIPNFVGAGSALEFSVDSLRVVQTWQMFVAGSWRLAVHRHGDRPSPVVHLPRCDGCRNDQHPHQRSSYLHVRRPGQRHCGAQGQHQRNSAKVTFSVDVQSARTSMRISIVCFQLFVWRPGRHAVDTDKTRQDCFVFSCRRCEQYSRLDKTVLKLGYIRFLVSLVWTKHYCPGTPQAIVTVSKRLRKRAMLRRETVSAVYIRWRSGVAVRRWPSCLHQAV